MDKLCKYLDRELEEYENKVSNGGKLSRTEIEDGKNIAKFKMALLTNDRMEDEGYSDEYRDDMRGSSMRGMSGARGRGSNARRDSRGRYSGESYSRAEAKEEFIEKVYDLMDEAPDDHTRKKFELFLSEMK